MWLKRLGLEPYLEGIIHPELLSKDFLSSGFSYDQVMITPHMFPKI